MKSKIAAFFRDDDTASADEPSRSDGGPTNDTRSSLFECPNCRAVFVAHEKTHCTDCDEPVIAVDQ